MTYRTSLLIPLLLLVVGISAGLAIPWDGMRNWLFPKSASEEPVGEEESHAGDENVVVLGSQTQSSIGLRTMSIQPESHQSWIELPAYLRELPGTKDLRLDSRFDGIVREVFVSQGSSVKPGDALFRLELTDPVLTTAQVELLDHVEKQGIVEQEIARLEPAVSGGGLANKSLLEARYEKMRIDATIRSRTQELRLRGISETEIETIVRTKELIREVTISLPENLLPPQLNLDPALQDLDQELVFEELRIKPGGMAKTGEPLCLLSWHALLAVEGQAYEKDLPRVREALGKGLDVEVAIGPGALRETIPNQRIASISSHVDEESVTFPFTVYLRNERLKLSDAGGGTQVAWKWKPGQPAHVRLPDRVFENQIVIPPEALAIDGPQSFVFRWSGQEEQHDHDHAHEPGEAHDESAHESERADKFEPVEVTVLHRDAEAVVIKPDEKLLSGDRIAANQATRLLFALKTGSGQGGGHGHDHGHHHGHEH